MSIEIFNREDKKIIMNQWMELFPFMNKYKSMQLGNTLGPLYVGIHLYIGTIKNQYIPYLYIGNLYNVSNNIFGVLIIQDKYNFISKNSQTKKYI